MPRSTRPLSALVACLALSVCLPACLFLDGNGLSNQNNTSSNNTTNNTTGNNTSNNTTGNNVVCANACFPQCRFDATSGEEVFVDCVEDEAGCLVEEETPCGPDFCNEVDGCTSEPFCDLDCLPGEVFCGEDPPGEGYVYRCEFNIEVGCHEFVVVEICGGGCSMRQGEEDMCAPPPPDCPPETCVLGERECTGDSGSAVSECQMVQGSMCPELVEVDPCRGRLGCEEGDVDGEAACVCNNRDACDPGSYECSGSGSESLFDVCMYDGPCTFLKREQMEAPCGPNGLEPFKPHGCTLDGREMLLCPGPDAGMCAPSEISPCPNGTVCVLEEVGEEAECVPVD